MGEPDQLRFLVATPIFNFWVRIGLLLLLLLIFQHLMPEKGGESSVAARPEPQRCDCKKFCYIRKFYDNIVSRTTFVQLPHKQPKHDYKKYFVGSEEHTSELQSHHDLVCRLLLEKKK